MKSKILFLIGLSLLFSCGNNSQNTKSKLWEDFKLSLEEKNLQYLIKNSFDSIKCIDCNIIKPEREYSSKVVFEKYFDKFYNQNLLKDKQYSVFKNDSILRINYSFRNKFGELSSNTIYMFDKKEDKFILSGMITVP